MCIYIYRERETDRQMRGFKRILLPILRNHPCSFLVPLNFYLNYKEGVKLRAQTFLEPLDVLDTSKGTPKHEALSLLSYATVQSDRRLDTEHYEYNMILQ
jgi:hypothetical protein